MNNDYSNFREELEKKLLECTEEVNFLYNNMITEKQNKTYIFSKSLFLLLYAHYEGFCNMLLKSYIQEINLQKLKRREVIEPLIVASMNWIFNNYENISRKNDLLKKNFPDDSNLHNYYRRIDFITQFDKFLEEIVKIEDKVINTESNLSVQVLEKNLYKLGLKLELTKDEKVHITKLLMIRNDIAHTGSNKILEKDFEERNKIIREIKEDIFKLMENLIVLTYSFLNEKKYLKNEN